MKNKLTIVNHNEQRILTTAQIAEAYETNERRISENFNANKERYVEGKHYYYLQGEDLKEFLGYGNSVVQNPSKVRSLYLWTEKGAFLHAKSLGTDRAWQVYEELIDTYFKINEIKQFKNLSPELQAIIMQDEKIQKVEIRVEKLEDDIHITRSQQKQLNYFAREVIIKALGSKYSTAYKEFSKRAFSEFWKSYQNAFNLASYMDTPKKDFQAALNFINGWKPSRELVCMIIGANAIIRED